jgi:hypothetical protein
MVVRVVVMSVGLGVIGMSCGGCHFQILLAILDDLSVLSPLLSGVVVLSFDDGALVKSCESLLRRRAR